MKDLREGVGFRASGLGFKDQGLGIRDYDLVLEVWDQGFTGCQSRVEVNNASRE